MEIENQVVTPIRKSGLAIASLVLGIISLLPMIGLLFAILAIIFGLIAKSKIKKGLRSGNGLATTGVVLGLLGIIITGYLLYSSVKSFINYYPDSKMSDQALSIMNADAEIIMKYKDKYGKFPASLTDLSTSDLPDATSFIKNDPWGTPISYGPSRLGNDYFELRSAGPDKKFNNSNDIAMSRPSVYSIKVQ